MGTDGHVIRSTDVRTSQLESGAWYRLLDGADYGFGDVSIIITEDPPNATGGADQKHRHPHISTLVITDGRGRFTIGDESLEAAAGDVVVVPANAWHSFVNTGDGALRFVGIDDTGRHIAEPAT